MNNLSFSTLALSPELLHNLETIGYQQMTEIQARSLPITLTGNDIIAQGKTGSGKTAAFGLCLLNKLNVKQFRVQTLVLCPTRELADQVAKEIRRLARGIHNIKVLTLCGGMPFGPQVGSLEHGAHIIVGTPGRVEDHIRKGNLKLDHVQTLVLDEADRMLDMGFQESLDNILADVPKTRQTLLYSATYPKGIKRIADRYMTDPEMVIVESSHSQHSISQHFYALDDNTSRDEALYQLLCTFQPQFSIVFCNTKRETDEIAEALQAHRVIALPLHGDMEQKQRDQTLVRFANKSASVLVATDVAARGLDIEDLDAVFNYQPARDSEVHVHRIGRTGRAGSTGHAFTLYKNNERFRIDRLESILDTSFEAEALPKTQEKHLTPTLSPPMRTLQIDGGKKQKVRAGDILGALTGDKTLTAAQVGKINIFPFHSYVAVERSVARKALDKISKGQLKGRNFRVRLL